MLEVTGWSAKIIVRSGIPPVHHGTSGFIPTDTCGAQSVHLERAGVLVNTYVHKHMYNIYIYYFLLNVVL